MTSRRKHMPVRSCISCGAKRGKHELIRLTLDTHGEIVRDSYGNGRGAYVCPSKYCCKGLEKRNCLNKAFKTKGPINFNPEPGCGDIMLDPILKIA